MSPPVLGWNRSGASRLGHGLAISGVLAITLLAFSPLAANDFVNYDDPFTLQRNEQLSAPGILRWAFTTNHMGHYQPLSWLAWSQLKAMSGLNPMAFHVASLLGHCTCVVLIYLLALRLSALARPAQGREHQAAPRIAALVASMTFAVHPVRVEAVAWASAFPYILSLSWLLVSLLAYLNYCTAPPTIARWKWFSLSIGCYALSLLSRPIAIAFPFVLAALDVYPLRRVRKSPGLDHRGGPVVALAEKTPFVAAALIAAVVESQSRELTGILEVGAGARLSMAAAAPFVYLWRILLPIGRSPVDVRPIHPQLEWVALLLGLAGIAALSAAAWRVRHRWPGLAVAWLAFLLLLAPVIGLTPSGQQVIADRYMYIPGVVPSLLAGGIIAAIASSITRLDLRRVSVVAVLALLALPAASTWRQTRWWRDSITLWTRAANLDPQNDIATYNLAIALADAGREEDAAARYEQTLRLVPDHAPARHNLTLIQARQSGRMGDQLASAGRFDEAVAQYSRVLELDSTDKPARASRGMALLRAGRFTEAAHDLRSALDARPDDRAIVNALAFALVQIGRSGDAVSVLKRALARHPEDDDLAHNLARVLATSPDLSVRDGTLALRLAIAVRDRWAAPDPRVLDTLAAAYAASGHKQRARTTAAEAVALAMQLGQPDVAAEISTRMSAYGR